MAEGCGGGLAQHRHLIENDSTGTSWGRGRGFSSGRLFRVCRRSIPRPTAEQRTPIGYDSGEAEAESKADRLTE